MKVVQEFSWKRHERHKGSKNIFSFGSGQLIYNTPQQVPSLKIIAQNCVEKFPLLIIQSAYAGVVHIKNKREWNRRKTINMTAYVPVVKDYIPLFYFPEFSQERQQMEIRTLDYTHQLTNLRGVVCRKKLQNVKRSEFV